MLSLKHEVFLEVARQLSFSKAGEVLYLSQPAISKHVKSLEDKYHLSLFERKGSSIKLTKSGEILYEHLLKARELQKQLEYDLSTYLKEEEAKGKLRLGASTTVTLYIIPPILSAFHQKYPQIQIRLVNRNSENILNALLNKEIDLGIIQARSKINTVSYQYFMRDEVTPVCSVKSPLRNLGKISLEKLKEIPIALRERGSGTLSSVENSLREKGIELNRLNTNIQLGGTEALKNFLLSDTCMGFLPSKSVAKEIRNGELIPLEIPELEIYRDFYFIQRQGSENDRLNRSFIKLAQAYYPS